MKNRKRFYILIGLITLLSLVFVSPVMASENPYVELLLGIKEFAVLIENLPPEIKREGLTENIIRTDVELKLRLIGIKVITWGERLKVPGAPYLYVSANIIKFKPRGYIYNITAVRLTFLKSKLTI